MVNFVLESTPFAKMDHVSYSRLDLDPVRGAEQLPVLHVCSYFSSCSFGIAYIDSYSPS